MIQTLTKLTDNLINFLLGNNYEKRAMRQTLRKLFKKEKLSYYIQIN